MPRCLRIAGSCQRRNGLVDSSSPIVVGSVGLPSARSASIFAARSYNAELVGSTVSAKRALASVYSWPQ
jgi:hypothetical protein